MQQVTAPVAHDDEHRQELSGEGEPYCPVQGRCSRSQRWADIRAFQEQRREHERGDTEHRSLESALQTFAARPKPRSSAGFHGPLDRM
jgi:hypothetical protein